MKKGAFRGVIYSVFNNTGRYNVFVLIKWNKGLIGNEFTFIY